MENQFEKILDKDEKIIKVFKPIKSKLYFATLVNVFLFSLFIAIPVAIVLLVEFSFNPTSPLPEYLQIIIFIAVGIILYFIAIAILYFLTWIFAKAYYNNLIFAYSNKRIIIRTGILGIDYKSLDMKMIGAINVYVSPIDKIHKKNTGTITFGSTASPISPEKGLAPYRFSHVHDPYNLYREVKSVIDEYKEKNLK
mgnify:CR=1 FL=1